MRTDEGRELLAELATAGVKVWADADGLGYEGPEGAITLERLESLSEHKSQIMALLSAETGESNVVDITGRPGSAGESLVAAGWQPRQRCGKTIWRHPETGFYYSEEMAHQMAGVG